MQRQTMVTRRGFISGATLGVASVGLGSAARTLAAGLELAGSGGLEPAAGAQSEG